MPAVDVPPQLAKGLRVMAADDARILFAGPREAARRREIRELQRVREEVVVQAVQGGRGRSGWSLRGRSVLRIAPRWPGRSGILGICWFHHHCSFYCGENTAAASGKAAKNYMSCRKGASLVKGRPSPNARGEKRSDS